MSVSNKLKNILGEEIAKLYEDVIKEDLNSSFPLLSEEEQKEIKNMAKTHLDASLTFDYKNFKVMLVTTPSRILPPREFGNAMSIQLVFKTKTMSAIFNNPNAIDVDSLIPKDPYLLVCTNYKIVEQGGRIFYNATDARALIPLVDPLTAGEVLLYIDESPRSLKDLKDRFGDNINEIIYELIEDKKIVLDGEYYRIYKEAP